MPVRVLDGCSGSGSLYDVTQGIRYAARLSNYSGGLPARLADVINLSLGGAASCDATTAGLVAEVRAQGVVLVAAAGNENTSLRFTPASCPGVIAVSAVGPAGADDLGIGLVNAFKAVQAVGTNLPPLPTPLTVTPSSLNFGDIGTAAEVVANNGGSGALTVTGTTTPATWLRVAAASVDASGPGATRSAFRSCEKEVIARAAKDAKMLATAASQLPLLDCTMPAECRCRYEKHKDRRGDDEERRLPGTGARMIWHGGQEKRKRRSRRKTDES